MVIIVNRQNRQNEKHGVWSVDQEPFSPDPKSQAQLQNKGHFECFTSTPTIFSVVVAIHSTGELGGD